MFRPPDPDDTYRPTRENGTGPPPLVVILLVLPRVGMFLVNDSAALFTCILPGNRLALLLIPPPVLNLKWIPNVCIPLGTLRIFAPATSNNENKTMIMKTMTVNVPESFYVSG